MKRIFTAVIFFVSICVAQAQIVDVTSASRFIAADAEGIGPTSPQQSSTDLGAFNRAVFDNSSSGMATASAGQNSDISASANALLVTDSSGARSAGGTGTPVGADALNQLTVEFTLDQPIIFSLDVTTTVQDGAPTGAPHEQTSTVRLMRDGVLLFGFGGTSTTTIGPRSGSVSGVLIPGSYQLALETSVHNAGDATREVTLLVGIPEPATASLLLLGGLVGIGRRFLRPGLREG